MENIVYNELLVRGYNVDVGIVDVFAKNNEGKRVHKQLDNCVATPKIIAEVSPNFAPYVESATVQCAAAVVVTVILVPILTATVAKIWGNNEEFEKRKVASKAS